MSAVPAYSRYDQRGRGASGRYGNRDGYGSYNGASTAPKHDRYERQERRQRYGQPERTRRPDINVVPGRRTQAHEQALPSSMITLAKTIAVVLVVLALLGCVRITLSSATVTTAIETRELSSQIDTARSEGSKLEVAQSSLSNPTRIKDAATLLGMSAPMYVTNIDLSGDVVVTDGAGNLSLSGSAAVLAQG